MKNKIKRILLTGVIFIASCYGNLLLAESNEDEGFDHSTTGYFLTGQHTILSCEACHIRGIFKGIPKTCEGCHERVIYQCQL